MRMLILLLAVHAGASGQPVKRPELPEDMGPAAIDVSDYPQEYQRTYRKVFIPVYQFLQGGAARAINSPLIEIDPRGEAVLRREHPELFADAGLAQVGADVWRREVARIKNRPPCCGACPVLSTADAKSLWRFLAYDSLRRKTGARTREWISLRRGLLKKFETSKSEMKKGDKRP